MREYNEEIREADADHESELQIKLTHMKISREDYKKYIFWKHCEQEYLDEIEMRKLLEKRY
jgi:hypothetical protein